MELATDNHASLLAELNWLVSFELRILNDSQSYDIHVLVIPICKKQILIYNSDLQMIEFIKMNV
jgi:hypothetical protein